MENSQTYLVAIQGLDEFRGRSTAELRSWLRRILLNNIVNTRRTYGAQKRDHQREQADVDIARLPSTDDGPRTTVARTEEINLLAKALGAISKDYQKVILLRIFEQRSWVDVGRNFRRSDEAARKLWRRAIDALRAELT